MPNQSSRALKTDFDSGNFRVRGKGNPKNRRSAPYRPKTGIKRDRQPSPGIPSRLHDFGQLRVTGRAFCERARIVLSSIDDPPGRDNRLMAKTSSQCRRCTRTRSL